MNDSAQRLTPLKPLISAEDYINSLRNRKLKVYLFGELIEDIVEHPILLW